MCLKPNNTGFLSIDVVRKPNDKIESFSNAYPRKKTKSNYINRKSRRLDITELDLNYNQNSS